MKNFKIIDKVGTNIKSIKRISDGQLFKLKDVVSLDGKWHSNDCILSGIRMDGDLISFFIKQGDANYWYTHDISRWVNITSFKNKEKSYEIY